MAISSPGIGSGLNITSIVSQLVAVEQQPVRVLQSKGATLQSKLSVFGTVKSDLSALQDAASALVSATTWDSKSIASSATANVTATIGASAMVGSFKVDVGNLATSQTLKFNAFSPAIDPLAEGSLTFQLGTWSGTSFAKQTDALNKDVLSVSVEVKSTDTLTTLASRINSSNAGVSAVVVSNGSTQQLVLRGSATGTNNGFTVSASAGLEQFQYKTLSTPYLMEPATMSTDASFSIEGIPITSHSNTVADAVPGVTLNLLTANSSSTVTVATDKDAIKAKIQAFQDAYNKINTDLKTYTAYNSTTKTGGPLLGDSTTAGLQNMLRTLVGSNGPSTSMIGRLSDLGLQIQADGSLSTKSTTLDAALQNPKNVKEFFSASNGTASDNGIARRIYDFSFGATGIGGSVSTHSAGFQKAIDQNTKAIDKFNAHIEDYQKQLLARYTQLDTSMASLNGLSTFVSAQISQWNKSS